MRQPAADPQRDVTERSADQRPEHRAVTEQQHRVLDEGPAARDLGNGDREQRQRSRVVDEALPRQDRHHLLRQSEPAADGDGGDGVGRRHHRTENQRGTERQRRHDPRRRTGDGDGGDDDEPDAEAEDRPDVAQERREREVQRRRVQQRRQHHRQQHLGFQFDAFEFRCERHRESDDDQDECGFQPAPMCDGSDHDGADDDEDQFHPAIVASIRRRCCVYFWQVGHQNRLRPSSSAVRIVVPHTRHGSAARR